MDREQQAEWGKLQAAAETALLAGLWNLRISAMPAFAESRTIGIQAITNRTPELTRRVGFEVVARVWKSRIDGTKLDTPVVRLKYPRVLTPTITERRRSIDSATLNRTTAKLANVSIPVYPIREQVVLDGTEFGLVAGNPNTSVELRWRCAAPSQWQPVMDWIVTTWNELADIAAVPLDDRPDFSVFTPRQ